MRQVTPKYALANDNSRLGDEMPLVIIDIVAELGDATKDSTFYNRLYKEYKEAYQNKKA